MIIAHKHYEYSSFNYYIIGINLYPLLLWNLGLFGSYELLKHVIEKNEIIIRIVLFSVCYWIILISLETIFYHIFGIKNLATSMYPELPICGCIHAPRWMQLGYFILGPIYYGIIELLLFSRVNKKNKNLITK